MKLIGKLPFLQLERPPDFTEGDGFGLFACVTSVHVSFYLHSQGIEHVGDGGVVYQLICRVDAVPFVKQVFYAFFISGIFVGFSVRFHGFPYICKIPLQVVVLLFGIPFPDLFFQWMEAVPADTPFLQVLTAVQILIVVHIIEADISGDIVFPGFRGHIQTASCPVASC